MSVAQALLLVITYDLRLAIIHARMSPSILASSRLVMPAYSCRFDKHFKHLQQDFITQAHTCTRLCATLVLLLVVVNLLHTFKI